MKREIATGRVDIRCFSRKLKVVRRKTRFQIWKTILLKCVFIDHFEYGHVPGERVYKIVLKNGEEEVWKLTR